MSRLEGPLASTFGIDSAARHGSCQGCVYACGHVGVCICSCMLTLICMGPRVPVYARVHVHLLCMWATPSTCRLRRRHEKSVTRILHVHVHVQVHVHVNVHAHVDALEAQTRTHKGTHMCTASVHPWARTQSKGQYRCTRTHMHMCIYMCILSMRTRAPAPRRRN